MQINFKEKSMTFDAPLSVFDAAAAAELVTRAHIAARVNGKLVGMTQILDADADVELLTFADPDGKHVFRHTASHILAQAVKRLYPGTKLTIGPAIDNGFYYDFDSDVAFTPEVLKALEGEMKKIVKLTGVEVVDMQLGEPDASGRRRPQAVEGSEHKSFTNMVNQIINIEFLQVNLQLTFLQLCQL